MLKNYIKTALRNFFREKGYSFINVMGLAIGITCSLLIALYIWDELRYDDFHTEKNLYRVALHRTFPANDTYWATSPAPMSEVLIREYPEVEKATRLLQFFSEVRARKDDDIYFESNVLAADSNFFDLFTIRLLKGNPDEALLLRNSVVLTESYAKKYFGAEDPIGKQIFLFSDTSSYMVTGVTEDVPSNCHFTYDMLLSLVTFPVHESTSWASYNTYNYVVLDRPESKENLESKFPALVEQYFGPEVETILGKKYEEYVAAGNHHYYHLQPIKDIHLRSNYQQELKANGDIRYVYLFMAVCFFILFVAGVNFTNLSTARSFRRAKEIGVRKVHGSLKRQLIFQFLTESVLTAFIALCISVLLIILLIPGFNDFTAKTIQLTQLNPFWAGLALITVLLSIGILAGIYPAFVISSFQPVKILKGKLDGGKGKSILRNALVVIQFGVSVVLIVSTLVIYRQLNFMRDKKLGFDKEHILTIERANLLDLQREAFSEEARQLTGVSAVGNSFSVPGRQFGGSTFQAIGAEATERINCSTSFCDFHFPTVLGIELVAGRTFSEDVASDSIAVVVNEALVKRVGWKNPEAAIGEKIRPVFSLNSQYEIIGVVKDFNYQSLHSAIEPLAFYGSDSETFNPTLCVVRIQQGVNVNDVVNRIQQLWSKFRPHDQFEYSFLDEEFDTLYRQEERFGKLFSLFSGLAILIASIGVIGLSTFMANQRTKEIGIRKVIGASVPSLLMLLSKEFLKLIVIANLIFWPLAWIGLDQWLTNYPFRTSVPLSLFGLTGLLTAMIVMISILWQSLKAALANPIKSLRSE